MTQSSPSEIQPPFSCLNACMVTKPLTSFQRKHKPDSNNFEDLFAVYVEGQVLGSFLLDIFADVISKGLILEEPQHLVVE